ncbi:MAG: ATP-binding cassette domain-containing protein [Lachnospiraceae bacterium]|nr:ATP-binding cassette domain-containing protein [Lachnospiraceae bacterium]
MIEIKNLSKSFGEKVVFREFSLKIEDGEFVVFAGNSGCGKTTLLNIIGALEKPDDGQVLVDGQDIYKIKKTEDYFTYKVGFLFQNFALIENKTVRKNLEYVQKKARTDISVEEALKRVGIEDKIDTLVYKLSGGEQQRVALARLMYKKCDIVLADEPTGSLDAQNAKIVIDFLHDLNKQGKTIVLVTHDEKIINSEEKVVWL